MASNNKASYLFLIADRTNICVLGGEDGHKINPGYIFQKVNITTFSHTYTHTHTTLFRKFIKVSNQEWEECKSFNHSKITITAITVKTMASIKKSIFNTTSLTLYVQCNLESAPIAWARGLVYLDIYLFRQRKWGKIFLLT